MSRSRRAHRLLLAGLALLVTVLGGATASAQAAGPAWTVTLAHNPSTFERLDQGDQYTVTAKNSGDTASAGAITADVTLPPELTVRSVTQASGWTCTTLALVLSGTPLSCTRSTAVTAGASALVVTVLVDVPDDAPDTVTNSATISGGGAASPASATDPTPVIDRPAFDVTGFTARSLDALGNDYTVAGGHPDHAATTFAFPTYTAFSGGAAQAPVEDVKDIFTELPPGFIGNAGAAPRCSLVQLQALIPACPAASKVGSVALGVKGVPTTIAVYNMIPEHGFPAEFAFKFANNSVVMYPQVRSRTGGYGLKVSVPGASRIAITSIALTFYGVPSGPLPNGNGTGGPAIPFLSNQSDCLVAQPASRIIVDSWQNPGPLLADGSPDISDPRWKIATAPAPPVTGCDAPDLMSQFQPTITAGPTPGTGSTQVDEPSGYSVGLAFPQTNDSTDPATTFDPAVPAAPQLKDTTVTLPEGVSISPSGANGLDACSDLASDPAGDQVRLDLTTPVTCPDASKIGTVKATSPLLAAHDATTDAVTGAEELDGDVYIIKPHPGDLDPNGNSDGTFRLLIQINNDKYGLNVKLPGTVTADKATGRLVARFEDNPQLPVKNLDLTFKPGQRAPLVNPATCVSGATTSGVFTPWSRPGTRSDGIAVLGTPDVTATSAFDVSWDGQGAGCPAQLPWGPQMAAGLADPRAGVSSAFTFDLTRGNREDVLSGLDVTLPTGLLAAVKGVPLCDDAAANAGACPADTRVGTATVAAGPGSDPYFIGDQPVYFTGAYKGGPYGLAIAVRAKAGPFDLGTVVVRQALYVDPNDAHVLVVSDPLPTIRDGVPLRVRRVHVDIDRSGFMQPPTSCAPKAIGSNARSLGGQTISRSAPFQMQNCSGFGFDPKLSMALHGKSETKDGGHPALSAELTAQPDQANLKSVAVTLPLSLALDPDNAASDDLCEYEDGLKDQCPEKSIVGTATAQSPLLNRPLTGPVYFVKNIRIDEKTGRQIKTLPTLLLDLNGEIHLTVRANSSVPDGKHLVSTFPLVPDAAISSFKLELNGGPHGILVVTNDANTCVGDQSPFMAAVAQNGKRVDTHVPMAVECPLALSRTFTKSSVKVKVTGIGAGKVTVSGAGVKKTSRTIKSATSATITAKLSARGKKLRKAHRDVRVKVTYTPAGSSTAQAAYSPKPKHTAKKSAKSRKAAKR